MQSTRRLENVHAALTEKCLPTCPTAIPDTSTFNIRDQNNHFGQ